MLFLKTEIERVTSDNWKMFIKRDKEDKTWEVDNVMDDIIDDNLGPISLKTH